MSGQDMYQNACVHVRACVCAYMYVCVHLMCVHIHVCVCDVPNMYQTFIHIHAQIGCPNMHRMKHAQIKIKR